MVRKATLSDLHTAAALALELWPDHDDFDELIEDFKATITAPDSAIFLDDCDHSDVGLAICQLRRDYVEGTESSPVGYLEGIYVRPDYRRQGRACELVRACEAWAKETGCTEFASDCPLDNEISLQFHLKAGFIVANRIICFTKQLTKE